VERIDMKNKISIDELGEKYHNGVYTTDHQIIHYMKIVYGISSPLIKEIFMVKESNGGLKLFLSEDEKDFSISSDYENQMFTIPIFPCKYPKSILSNKNFLINNHHHPEYNLMKWPSVKKVLFKIVGTLNDDERSWDGYFTQKILGIEYLIRFTQFSNHPNPGFTLHSGAVIAISKMNRCFTDEDIDEAIKQYNKMFSFD
jgi:hypothetical protein